MINSCRRPALYYLWSVVGALGTGGLPTSLHPQRLLCDARQYLDQMLAWLLPGARFSTASETMPQLGVCRDAPDLHHAARKALAGQYAVDWRPDGLGRRLSANGREKQEHEDRAGRDEADGLDDGGIGP